MPATSLNPADLSDLGLSTETDLATQDQAHLDEISANDPFMADLLKSMEQATPTAADLEKALRGQTDDTATETGAAAGSADDAPAPAPAPVASDPLAKPGEVAPAPAPVVDNGEQAPASAAGEPAPVSGEPPAVTPPTPTQLSDTLVVDMGNGNTASIDTDTARRLLGLDAWAQNLRQTPGLAEAIAAVEDGHAIPVPREQYEQFRVWLAGGQRDQSAPLHQTAPQNAPTPAPLPELDEYADPATRALYATVQQTQAELQQLRQASIDQQRAAEVSRYQAILAERERDFTAAFQSQAEEMGLTPAELNRTLAHAAESRLIQSVNLELAPRHPFTGAIVGDPDATAVARATFERAVYQIPELRDRVIAAQVQTRLDSERAAVTSINAKRNRAASLSSAPSAAITSTRDPKTMTPQEREAAIAAELRAAISA